MNWLLNWLFGYLKISVKSSEAEHAINFLFQNRIRFFSVKKIGEQTVSFCVRLNTANECISLLNIQKNRVGLEYNMEQIGFFPWLMQYKLRFGLILGCLLGIFLVILSTFFVWGVTIETNTNQYSYAQLNEMLQSFGVKPGALKQVVTDREFALQFQLRHPEFIFVSFHAEGVRLVVELMQRTLPPEAEDDFQTTHLISDYAGIIRSVNVLNGEPMVLAGDAVNRGDLLVSGAITLRAGGYRLVESKAEIFAETARSFECFVPFEQVTAVSNGVENTQTSILFLGGSFSFGKIKELLDGTFEEVCEERQVVFLGRECPFKYVRVTQFELEEVTKRIDCDEARKRCVDKCREWLSDVLGDTGKVLSADYQFTESSDGIELNAEFTCLEDICESVPFDFKNLAQ